MSVDLRLFLGVTLPLATLGLINQAARTVMAVIGPVLAVEFALSGSELGLLGASMLAAYALSQLPDGVALDRLGPRRVQTMLSLLTAAGFALFALSDSLGGFILARVIIGIGVSAGLMAVIKANTDWFAPARVAKVTGIAVAIGALGSVLTTAPVQAALPVLGWRGVLWLLCAVAAAVAVWILASVPERPGAAKRGALKSELAVAASIYRSPVFWRFGPVVAVLSVLNFAYLGLWAGPWLRDVAGYDGPTRANTLLFYTLSMMAGAVVIGAATGRARARGHSAMLVPLACIAGQVAAQIGLALQPAGGRVRVLRRRRRARLRRGRPAVSGRADGARGDRDQHPDARRGLRAAGRDRLDPRFLAAHRGRRLGPRGVFRRARALDRHPGGPRSTTLVHEEMNGTRNRARPLRRSGSPAGAGGRGHRAGPGRSPHPADRNRRQFHRRARPAR